MTYLLGALQGLLDVEAFAHDGGVELAFEGEEVHIGLRLRHKVPHALRQDLICHLLLLLTADEKSPES